MTKMSHIAFNCVDKRKQETFYTEMFGFRRVCVFNTEQEGEFVLLRLGDMRIELFQAPESASGLRGEKQRVGFWHLAFEVENLEEMIAKLNAGGIETGEIEDCSSLAEGLRVCFFKDPEGNELEIMEGWADQT